MTNTKIGVFCAASDRIDPVYVEKAKEFGAWLGDHHKWLVYGGSNTGLMEAMAREAKAHGAMLMGVVPSILEERARVSELLDVTFPTVNLSDRKEIMLQEADVLVALPGGVGTLDEIFHVVASGTLGYHHKKVILYNVEGCWDGLLALLDGLEANHFIHRPLAERLEAVSTFEELTALLSD